MKAPSGEDLFVLCAWVVLIDSSILLVYFTRIAMRHFVTWATDRVKWMKWFSL